MTDYYWHNDTGPAQDVLANDGSNYIFWFLDAGHTTPVPYNGGEGFPGYPTGGENPNIAGWTGSASLAAWGMWTPSLVSIAAGLNILFEGGTFVLPGCTVGAGATFAATGPGTFFVGACQWLGNIEITGCGVQLDSGWTAAAGADITLGGGGDYVILGQQGTANPTYHNVTITVNDYGGVDLSQMQPFRLTGAFQVGQEPVNCTVMYPGGLFQDNALVTLAGNNAVFAGAKPATNTPPAGGAGSVLAGNSYTIYGSTTNGTFNEAARNTDPGVGNVKQGTEYSIAGQALTGTLSASGGRRVVV